MVASLDQVYGAVELDDVCDAAIIEAERRIRGRLSSRGPIEETGRGFDAYCRVVLRNEIRRQMVGLGRRQAGQLTPDEAMSFRLPDIDENWDPEFAPLASSLVLGVNAWPHRYHQDGCVRAEQAMGEGLLAITLDRSEQRVTVGDGRYRDRFLELTAPPGQTMRISNGYQDGLHMRISVIALEVYGKQVVELPVKRLLLDTKTGVSPLDHRTVLKSAQRGWGHPVEPQTNRGRPLEVPLRTFEPCVSPLTLASAGFVAAVKAMSSPSLGDPNSTWLHQRRVAEICLQVVDRWLTGPAERKDLICALTEWLRPGLHRPHRVGHPGAFPMEAFVREEVGRAARDFDRGFTSVSNKQQAESRMYRKVRTRLAEAAESMHNLDVIT